ncbi:hypothetical protein [Vibrio breoganii]|uniref:hypothetical protein n=1 Tax=Vibrio breoganii TaxID=553239 RepID=UPI0039A47045
MSKWVLDEPFLPSPSGSALLGISTALVTFHVEPPHLKATNAVEIPNKSLQK